MDVKFLGHAGIRVTACGISLLVDPWLSRYGAFLGSWFQFPIPLEWQDENHADFVFISHEHEDHFDAMFLETMDRSTPILISDWVDPYLPDQLEKLGFSDVRLLRDGEPLELAPDFVVTAIKDASPIWDDAGLIIEAEGGTVWHQNDLKLNRERLEELGSKHDIDLCFGQYSGAIWYPHVYEGMYDDAKVADITVRKVEAKYRHFLEYMDHHKASYTAACAGPPIFLDPNLEKFSLMDPTVFPTQEDLLRFAREHAPDKADKLLVPFPGDVYTIKDGEVKETSKKTLEEKLEYLQDKEARLREYQSLRQAELVYIKTHQPAARPGFDYHFRQYMTTLVRASPYFRERINMAVRFTLDGPFGGDYTVDWRDVKEPVRTYEGQDYGYHFRMPVGHAQDIIDGHTNWENFFLSHRFRAKRDPDVYNDYLMNCLKHARKEKLDAIRDSYLKERPTEFIDIVGGNGKSYCIQRECPHAGHDLKGSQVDGSIVVCDRHGWRFDMETGECLDASGVVLHVKENKDADAA